MTAIPRNDAAGLLGRMWLIRAFEEKASELFARGEISGLLHLGIGQEGSAVGTCSALRSDDLVFGAHRSHAHAIAKGADIERLMAELAGRTSGYCRGKGGSMHISAPEVGFVTATGVVAGNLPLALGGALTAMSSGSDAVSVAFFGDGAGQTGGFHESLNLAALWQMPIVFLCENNGFAEFSPLSAHTVVEHLADYARVYDMPAVTVAGNDILAVRDAVDVAVDRARSGGGPTFVECLTHRLRGHYEGDPAKYRESISSAEWKALDPINRFVESHRDELSAIASDVESDARRVVALATEAALAAPPAPASGVSSEVYAS